MDAVRQLVRLLRRVVGPVLRALLPRPVDREATDQIAALRRELAATKGRIADMEAQVQETRRLHQRVAELTDVVAEVLVPASDRDDARLRETLARYAGTLS
ncbi:DUF6752 domain-containing protein [Jatrophihabitans fulvus]